MRVCEQAPPRRVFMRSATQLTTNELMGIFSALRNSSGLSVLHISGHVAHACHVVHPCTNHVPPFAHVLMQRDRLSVSLASGSYVCSFRDRARVC
jgi:hypothetical protein